MLFLALNNINFQLVLRKSLRKNTSPMILSNTPSWYFLQYHQRYSLQYTSHANHVSTPFTLPTLVHHPCHPRWHVTQARCPHNPRQHATHTDTCISVNLAKFYKKTFSRNTCKWLVLDFTQLYMSHSIIYFIKRNSKKRNYDFLNAFNSIST